LGKKRAAVCDRSLSSSTEQSGIEPKHSQGQGRSEYLTSAYQKQATNKLGNEQSEEGYESSDTAKGWQQGQDK
jgi:hypothetical protein